ncbi:YopX family protein [Cellulosilyticum lentocellum]|uniref:YopX protein domain-containing protein n=1 Tax=Cellulosilyticum lentocellum (strain ATCC 49066 / DSM 5427 / NCIMB 11756 / RHM5) TaxID=642492 RepID=F2JK53_CELLD|nr:YopX family protein [Cellulosilyticum lentocellum]ADZ82543.1 Conserved hypothetical protein CHP01671 [Cellulosilyticum lentocellum DSM 5427]ADZ84468.1 Conserved hypothetical protein CHP01671 [Cellulosilyticum lentocellum DSM 5427]
MREIKFRGYNKEFDGDQFVYGETILFQEYKQQWVMLIENELGEQWVDIKEPQQYTGLEDKNGKEIYEGDIVKVKDNYIPGEVNIDINGEVKFKDASFCISGSGITRYRWCDYEIEVIGNIYENLDLLD